MGAYRMLLLRILASVAASEVIIIPSVQVIYSTTPLLQISVSGYRSVPKMTFDPKIDEEAYEMTIKEGTTSVVYLHLKKDRSWPTQQADRTSLKVVSYEDSQGLVETEVEVAQIIKTPLIDLNEKKLVSQSTKFVTIEGSFLKNAKLTFDPFLSDKNDYYFSNVGTSSSRLTVRLKPGKKWRSEPGPLKIVGVDTGAGRLSIDVQIAAVQMDLTSKTPSGVTVDSKAVIMYESATYLAITGSGFNRDPRFYFASDFGFNVTGVQSDTVTLTSTKWRSNGIYPGNLVVLAVDAGFGIVPVGPTMTGSQVATVLEDPNVDFSQVKVDSGIRQLLITGRGFTKDSKSFETRLVFDPTLTFGYDYIPSVQNSTHLYVILTEGHEWAPHPGPLKVKAIDTGAGFYSNFEPVIVAYVQKKDSDDDDAFGDSGAADGPLVIVSGVAFATALVGAMLLAGIFTALKRRALQTFGYGPPPTHSSYEMPLYATVHGSADSVDLHSLQHDDFDDLDNDDDDDAGGGSSYAAPPDDFLCDDDVGGLDGSMGIAFVEVNRDTSSPEQPPRKDILPAQQQPEVPESRGDDPPSTSGSSSSSSSEVVENPELV